MNRKDLRIGIVTDSRNQCIAETYFSLLKESAYAPSQCSRINFDYLHPGSATGQMEKQHVMLASIGLPGRDDYQQRVGGFLEAFAAVKRKPPTGLVTHDCDHTRYVIDRWLGGDAQSPRDLPDGILSIVDAARPLRLRALEKALDILIGNMPVLPPSKYHAIPFTRVQVDSLSARVKIPDPV